MALFFSREGPGFFELARQALSSTRHGYDLLAPKFDRSPFRTPDRILDASAAALQAIAEDGGTVFRSGLDLCCGTGAGVERVLRRVCRGPLTAVDFSFGMLAEARRRLPGQARWVQADVRALPFRAGAFDLVVSFGAHGHFLRGDRPDLFAQVHAALRPAGVFAVPLGRVSWAQPLTYVALSSFDLAMRVRNAVWRPRFIMYYRTWPIDEVRRDLERTGFAVTAVPLNLDMDYHLLVARRQP